MTTQCLKHALRGDRAAAAAVITGEIAAFARTDEGIPMLLGSSLAAVGEVDAALYWLEVFPRPGLMRFLS